MKNLIFHNDRADMVKNLLFKNQVFRNVAPKSPQIRSSHNRLQETTSRIVKILEIAKKIKSIPQEENKYTDPNVHIEPLTAKHKFLNSSNKLDNEKINSDDFEVLGMLKNWFGF